MTAKIKRTRNEILALNFISNLICVIIKQIKIIVCFIFIYVEV